MVTRSLLYRYESVMTNVSPEGAALVTAVVKTALSSDDVKMVEATVMRMAPTLKKVFSERPNEMITLAMNIKNIFENHNSDLIVAHMKAQDTLHINGWNKDPDKMDVLTPVPLRSTADMARAKFDTFNAVKLYLYNKESNNMKVNVEGFTVGLSKVHKCDAGYAVGYYSYASGEKMELFFHVDDPYVIEYESFSKKFWEHEVKYDLYYQYNSLGKEQIIMKRISYLHETTHLGYGPETDWPHKTPKEMPKK